MAIIEHNFFTLLIIINNFTLIILPCSQIGGCLVFPYPHHVVAMGYNTVPDGRDFTGASVDWNPPNQKKYSKYVCLSTDNGFTIALPYVTLETLCW